MRSRIQLARRLIGTSPGELERRQRLTLELGSWVVLASLGLGLQFGRWSAWSVLVAIGGYLIWVVMYSEATVQAGHKRARALRVAGLSSEEPGATPGDEQRSPDPSRQH